MKFMNDVPRILLVTLVGNVNLYAMTQREHVIPHGSAYPDEWIQRRES